MILHCLSKRILRYLPNLLELLFRMVLALPNASMTGLVARMLASVPVEAPQSLSFHLCNAELRLFDVDTRKRRVGSCILRQLDDIVYLLTYVRALMPMEAGHRLLSQSSYGPGAEHRRVGGDALLGRRALFVAITNCISRSHP